MKPWQKIQFKSDSGHIYDGYVYTIVAGKYYVSQNSSYETMGLAQNWVIDKDQILKIYDEEIHGNQSNG